MRLAVTPPVYFAHRSVPRRQSSLQSSARLGSGMHAARECRRTHPKTAHMPLEQFTEVGRRVSVYSLAPETFGQRKSINSSQ